MEGFDLDATTQALGRARFTGLLRGTSWDPDMVRPPGGGAVKAASAFHKEKETDSFDPKRFYLLNPIREATSIQLCSIITPAKKIFKLGIIRTGMKGLHTGCSSWPCTVAASTPQWPGDLRFFGRTICMSI